MEVNCPTCKKKTPWENNPDRPFCSERCRLIDLGAWAMEKHAVPGDHTVDTMKPPTGESPEEEEE